MSAQIEGNQLFSKQNELDLQCVRKHLADTGQILFIFPDRDKILLQNMIWLQTIPNNKIQSIYFSLAMVLIIESLEVVKLFHTRKKPNPTIIFS